VTFALSTKLTPKAALAAILLAPALLGGCSSRDAQMAEQIAAANAAAMRAEQAAQRAEHAAANAQRAQPDAPAEADVDPSDDQTAPVQPKTAEAHPDSNSQTVEG
jgi:predicted exporter